MFAVLVFSLVGLAIGGVRGVFIGAAVGYLLGWLVRRVLARGLAEVQLQFVDSTFAVMGALCKADGVVTRDEIAIAEAMFARLHLSDEQRATAQASFARGKAPDFNLDEEIARFAQASRGSRPILVMFLQVQCAAIAADGNVHPAEHRMLVRIAQLLGLTEADLAQLEALLRASSGTQTSSFNQLEDAYAALGVSASSTDAQIKQAYRRLMSQNHPDKLTGKGLPESMREMAEQRTREISTAYALIKEARGFS